MHWKYFYEKEVFQSGAAFQDAACLVFLPISGAKIGYNFDTGLSDDKEKEGGTSQRRG